MRRKKEAAEPPATGRTGEGLAIVPSNVETIAPRAESQTPLRDSIREILAMPIIRRRHEEFAEFGRVGKKSGGQAYRFAIGLEANEILNMLMKSRGKKVPTSGYDRLAAEIVAMTTIVGLSKLQAVRLVVDLIEPVDRPIDLMTPAREMAERLGVPTEELIAMASALAAGDTP